MSSPHVFLYMYINLTQLHSQSSWFSGVSFSSRGSDSVSCPYRRPPFDTTTPAAQADRCIRMREYVDTTWSLGITCGGDRATRQVMPAGRRTSWRLTTLPVVNRIIPHYARGVCFLACFYGLPIQCCVKNTRDRDIGEFIRYRGLLQGGRVRRNFVRPMINRSRRRPLRIRRQLYSEFSGVPTDFSRPISSGLLIPTALYRTDYCRSPQIQTRYQVNTAVEGQAWYFTRVLVITR